MSIPGVLNSTDWALLAQQKEALVGLSWAAEHDEIKDVLEGVIAFLDAIQDAAHEDGYPVVFLTEEGQDA